MPSATAGFDPIDSSGAVVGSIVVIGGQLSEIASVSVCTSAGTASAVDAGSWPWQPAIATIAHPAHTT